MIAQTASKFRSHLDHFSGRLSAGLGKVVRRFVGETMYGVVARIAAASVCLYAAITGSSNDRGGGF